MSENDSAASGNISLTLIHLSHARPATYSLEAAAQFAGVHPEMLRYYCRLGLLGETRTGDAGDPTFDDDALYELRQLETYRRHHGVDRPTLRLICELRREVVRLQAEVRFLRGP